MKSFIKILSLGVAISSIIFAAGCTLVAGKHANSTGENLPQHPPPGYEIQGDMVYDPGTSSEHLPKEPPPTDRLEGLIEEAPISRP